MSRKRQNVLEKVNLILPRQARCEDRFAAAVNAEFPSLTVSLDNERRERPHLHAWQWDGPQFDFWRFDVELDQLVRERFALQLAGNRRRTLRFTIEVLNRCQRLIARRNRDSQGELFDRALRAHRGLHDLDKPLVRADYNHSLDVWQWVLRLRPSAPLTLQIAALFHDVERLRSEPDVRVEQHAPDYQAFKNEHARNGAAMTERILRDAGISRAIGRRAADIIARHEEQSLDEQIATLNDADALSFFSLNSSGYAAYFGPEQTRKKVAWTWRRMRPIARTRLCAVRLRSDVRSYLEEVKESEHESIH